MNWVKVNCESVHKFMRNGICMFCNQPGASFEEILMRKLDNPHNKCFLPKTITELKNDLADPNVSLKDILAYLIIPESGRSSFLRAVWQFHWKIWSFPPTHEQFDQIISWGGREGWIELGAGSGLLAALFKKAGVNFVKVTDRKIGQFEMGFITMDEERDFKIEPYIEMEELTDSDAMAKYHKQIQVVLVSWANGVCISNVGSYSEVKYIVHIGENEGGCTYFGTPDPSQWKIVIEIDIPRWEGLSDYLTIYQRI